MSVLKGSEETELNGGTTENGHDDTDKPPSSHHVSYCSIVSNFCSIIFHCFDCGFDMYVAYNYFASGRHAYGAWSLAFLVVPSIILALVSIRMYVDDINRGVAPYKPSVVRIVLCVLGVVIQSAPLIRHFDALKFAVKGLIAQSRADKKGEQEQYFLKTLNEEADTAFLKLFEAYLESAPQQVLQMTLLLVDHSQGSYVHSTRQIISIIFGFISMSLSIVNYNRCIRFDQKNKQNIPPGGLTVQFFWHLTFTVSRILAISALASLYALWTCIALVIHWCVASIWLAITSKTSFCGRNSILEVLFSCTVGLVYIFNFLNLHDGPTKNSYLVFFTVIFIENTIASAIWGVKSSFRNWVYYMFTIFPLVFFVLSVVFIIMYYQKVHPNKVKSKIPRNDALEQRLTLTDEPKN